VEGKRGEIKSALDIRSSSSLHKRGKVSDMRSSQSRINFKMNLKDCRTDIIKPTLYSYATPDWIIHARAFRFRGKKEKKKLAAIKQEVSNVLL
jgi:hypothetical protein